VSVSSGRSDPETCGLSWNCSDQWQNQNNVKWQWKEDFIWDIKYIVVNKWFICVKTCGSLCHTEFVIFHFYLVHRYRRADESKARFPNENSSFGLCPFLRWRPAEPSDGTIHSWPGQPLCVPCSATPHSSSGSGLTVVWHSAEPPHHAESTKTLVNLHRWEGDDGIYWVIQLANSFNISFSLYCLLLVWT